MIWQFFFSSANFLDFNRFYFSTSNSQQDGLHTTQIHLQYKHNSKDVILDLQLNDNLIPLEHFMSYQLPNGDKAIKNFTKTDIDLCHYHVSIFSDLTWLHKCFSFFSQLGNSGVVAGVCDENGNDRQPRWEFINGTRRALKWERKYLCWNCVGWLLRIVCRAKYETIHYQASRSQHVMASEASCLMVSRLTTSRTKQVDPNNIWGTFWYGKIESSLHRMFIVSYLIAQRQHDFLKTFWTESRSQMRVRRWK